jgi:hypothetical protein
MNQKHLKASWKLYPEQNIGKMLRLFRMNILFEPRFNEDTNKWYLKCIKHRFIPLHQVENINGFNTREEAEVYLALIED